MTLPSTTSSSRTASSQHPRAPPTSLERSRCKRCHPYLACRSRSTGAPSSRDDHGFVRIDVDRWSPDLKERIKIPDTALADGSRASFSRWFDWSNTIQDDVIAAFLWISPSRIRSSIFKGNPVDPATIDSLTFKSSTGVSNTFKQGEHSGEHMLRGSRVVPTQAEPINKNLYYTLESVMVRGSDVVNRAQQRYFPATEPNWTVQVRYFFVDFTARDAFFGFPIGSAVKLVEPDGTVAKKRSGQARISGSALSRAANIRSAPWAQAFHRRRP